MLRPAISPLKRIVAIICNTLDWNGRLRNGFRVVSNVHLVTALKPSIKQSRNNRPGMGTRDDSFLKVYTECWVISSVLETGYGLLLIFFIYCLYFDSIFTHTALFLHARHERDLLYKFPMKTILVYEILFNIKKLKLLKQRTHISLVKPLVWREIWIRRRGPLWPLCGRSDWNFRLVCSAIIGY